SYPRSAYMTYSHYCSVSLIWFSHILVSFLFFFFFFFQAEDGIRDRNVTGVQTCALPIFGDRSETLLAQPRREAQNGVHGGREVRSEERRVGKECRTRYPNEEKKKIHEVVYFEATKQDMQAEYAVKLKDGHAEQIICIVKH